MKKEIYDVYESIRPDEEAKQRMFQNIMLQNAQKKEDIRLKTRSKFMIKAAAAAAVIIAIPTVAFATGLFGLHEVKLGKQTLEIPKIDEQGQVLEEKEEQEVDMISLQGVVDSPEYQACLEWMEFSENYDKDEAILSKVGNNPTGFEEEYGEYLCYTQEMADKIDEICEKYNLKKLTGFEVAADYQTICERVGIGDIMGKGPEAVGNTISSGYFYADGSFHMEGDAVIISEQGGCKTDYQLIRSVKGTFGSSVLNIGNVNDYEQWEYTTANGETVLLANSSHKALIMVEKENSFVTVNVLGDISGDSFDISNENLEKLAEMFDFSVIS